MGHRDFPLFQSLVPMNQPQNFGILFWRTPVSSHQWNRDQNILWYQIQFATLDMGVTTLELNQSRQHISTTMPVPVLKHLVTLATGLRP